MESTSFMNWKWLTLISVFVITVLWRKSSSFRYLVKISAYYFCFLISSFACTVLALKSPGDPHNMVAYFNVLQYTTSWLNIKWEIRGAENLESDTPAVLVANHQTSIDFQGMGHVWPSRCVVMVKKSFRYIPGVNLAAWLASAVLIDRFNTDKAKQTLAGAVAEIKQKNLKLWVFPEGTRYHHEGMLPFKKGGFHVAVQAQIPIIPVVFSCVLPFYSKNELRFESDGLVIVKVLREIPTIGLTTGDVDSLIETTRNTMLETYKEITVEAKRRYIERDF